MVTDTGFVGSMGTTGDGNDNAFIESIRGKPMQVGLPSHNKWQKRLHLPNARLPGF